LGIPQTDIKPQLQPQDSIPEMVSSPTDVGIYDGGHQGEKMTWYALAGPLTFAL